MRTIKYEVTVVWGGELFSHIGAGLVDALEWVRSYPADAVGRVWRAA